MKRRNTVAEMLKVRRENHQGLKHYAPEALFKTLEPAERITTAFMEEAEKVLGNDHLSPKGRAEKLREIASARRAELATWREKSVTGLDGHAKALLASVRPPAPKSTDVAERIERALKLNAISAQLQGYTTEQIELLYRGADELTREAIENSTRIAMRPGAMAPSVQPAVRPEVIAEVMEERLLLEHPELAAQIDDIREFRASVLTTSGMAERLLDETLREANLGAVPIPNYPPVPMAARGK